ncbi:MAG: hypothetical protein LBN23_02175 [Paludibacter sp.]|nr:hypothetical protein [Paludibacter sp.]
MNNEQFNREKLYQINIIIAQKMFKTGVITEEEFCAIDTIMLEKYRPLLGSIFLAIRAN